MFINYDRNKLEKALYDFSNATGINISILDENFVNLGFKSNIHHRYCFYIQNIKTKIQQCRCSDLELLNQCKQSHTAQYHICHAGLVDVAVPILYNNEIMGYLILGQMKKDDTLYDAYENGSQFTPDGAELKRLYEELPLFDEKKIESVINIAVMLTKYILLERMLYPVSNDMIVKATNFINTHLSEPLDIQKLSDSTGYSASALYKGFHKYYRCTVGQYITERKINDSIRLLLETDFSIEEISQKVGFSSAPYFSKTFKDKVGVSPLKFRRSSPAKSISEFVCCQTPYKHSIP